MAQLQHMLDALLLQYEGYFNIEKPYQFAGQEILAHAHFERHNSKYVLVKRAQLFAIETHEYVFFVHKEHLDQAAWEFEKSRILLAESDYVKPHSEHMYSYITLLLLCDVIDDDVKRQIRKISYMKNYKFSLHGYSTVRVAAIELSTEEVLSNPRGREIKKVLDQALHM